MFALIDINAMYCACEAAFRPDLVGKPIVVLSNNDATIVALNQLAKRLGLKRGDPYFRSKYLLARHNVAVFSSNYTLYSGFSSRFYSVIESLAARTAVYSIDEMFADAGYMGNAMSLDAFGCQLRDEVERQTTLTCGVGIAATKTLAKICNYAAKTWPATGGVVALTDRVRLQKLLNLVPAGKVWGVGRRTEVSLNSMGITTALELARLDTHLARRQFGVTLERTIRELRGEVCYSLEEGVSAKQQIVVSRSFGERVNELQEMQQAIAGYAVRAAEKLRQEHRWVRGVTVFIRSNAYNPRDTQYANQGTEILDVPTQDTRDVIEAAQRALGRIWRDDIRYAKAGVMLCDLQGKEMQFDLFASDTPRRGSEKLMQTLDKINKEGRSQVFFAGEGVKPPFAMRRQLLSPAYLTRWHDIPAAFVR
ncbi:TPA: translesion error-prone DNA polymerase V subunit UmuC [Yersinia enterocolitica]